jgi:hypothetical protein
MELLLNIIWLALAAAAFGWLLPGAMAARGRGRAHCLQAILALGCVAALLFPIISITDDLSAGHEVLEESAAARRWAMAVATGVGHAAAESASAAVLIATLIVSTLLAAVARVETEVVPALSERLTLESDPRSPPSG